jgi:tetratricopeptide (TPR) repeat protein
VSENGSTEVSRRVQMLVTAGIAVTTLAVAATGYLQVRANSKSGDAAQAGQEYSVLTMSNLLQSQERVKVDYERFLQAQEQGNRAGNAFQQGVFSAAGEKALLRLVQERWQRLANKTQALTPITLNSRDGPRQDSEFPRHVFARSTGGALRYQALQDAANQQNSAWESRAAKYTAVLTLLAVALYLFGFALAMPRRVLGVFGAAGAVLLAVGVGWAGAIAATSPKRIPANAAAEYSAGEVALETSTIGQDPAGFAESIDHFTKAIEAWPGFARAYLGRANARLSSAPQVQASLIPPDELKAVISDLNTARGFGLDSGLVLEQLAGSEFSVALHDQPRLFRQAAAHAREAIAKVPHDPVARYSLAVALLGAGDVEAADRAYRDAIESSIYLDVSTQRRRNAPAFEEVWVSGALSDLEALRAAKPGAVGDIARAKALVVSSVAAGRVTEPGQASSFDNPQVQVTPTSVAWATAGASGFAPERDVLSVQWYTRQPGQPWIGLPEVSGRVDPRVETSVPRYSARNLTSSSIPPRCLGAGDYQVELYLHGRLAASTETSVSYAPLKAYIDRALNLEVCHPADWQFSKYSLPGFRQGLVSVDGARGVYLIRYDLSLLPAKLRKLPTEQITDGLLTSTVTTTQYLLPARVSRTSAVQHQPSIGLQGSSQRSFAYAGGLAYGQCAIDEKDKAAFVTLVFGPQASFQAPDGDLLPVVISLSEYRFGGSSF